MLPRSARPDKTTSDTNLGSPGHLRDTVSPEQVTVDYIRSYVEEKPSQQNGQVDAQYIITP